MTTQTKRAVFGTRFELDEEKILREGKYSLDSMYAKIEELATKRAKLTKVSKNHYEFRGEKDAQAHLGILVFNCLSECEWFTKNVKSWEWLGGSNDENYIGDLIALLKKEKLGVRECEESNKKLKTLIIDLDTKALKEHYKEGDWHNASNDIANFLSQYDFIQVQDLMYDSTTKFGDDDFGLLISKMSDTLTWLPKCIKRISSHDQPKIINYTDRIKKLQYKD